MADFSPGNIHIDKYDYALPDNRIARFPAEQRQGSRLLLYNQGQISHTNFESLTNYIGKDQLIVFNNTRVIQARIIMYKPTGSKIEIFLLEPLVPHEYSIAFAASSVCRWKCMTGNKKKWKSGKLEKVASLNGREIILYAVVAADHGSWQEIDFSWEPHSYTFAEIIDSAGATPIPPYLNRLPEEADRERYQTIYSRYEGSVAAPTAGLHFTAEILNELKKIAAVEEITLHVGAGTFQPVKSATIDNHSMHTEHFSVTAETIENIKNHKGEITSVGTTSARAIESLYWLGVNQLQKSPDMDSKPGLSQWEAFTLPDEVPRSIAMQSLLDMLAEKKLNELSAKTSMMIIPGYRFRIINRLITNFHQPKSTLLLLIASFIGDDWQKVYEYALANDFRFLSYGDSSLLIPRRQNM